MTPLFVVLAALAIAVVLLHMGRGLWAWIVPGALLLGAWAWKGSGSPVAFACVAIPFVILAFVFGVTTIRRTLVTPHVLRMLAPIFPKMSDTERTALDAGTVWWDAELFSGNPNWKKLIDFTPRPLSAEERRFLDGPVEELCRMCEDWKIHERGDLEPEAWDFIKRQRFMGMIIPKEHGGLGFSAIANSSVVAKLASRSMTAAISVMVPNSLGPAELLLHYGTDEQKRHYLPRLAVGDEVPCFALTEPHAGSDAGGMRSTGVVCRGTFEGKDVLGMRLTWDKRYCTLAPVASLIGLAFRLHDPDRLLGDKTDLGITCALIPANLPGIEIGDRHNPLDIPFMNGTTRAHDLFVPIEFVIGGPKMVGQGWRMLMECLSAGRAISLPASSLGNSELAVRVVSAYASLREQFNLPIGKFEGVEAPLARIGGTTYWMNAMRWLTAGAVDAGEKPAVISAIAKAYATEAARRVINDAMDVQGGAGISKGPRNTLAHTYQCVPIGITVEGANILTRTMIIFGQGAIRCHPYALKEVEAAQARDVEKFDDAFFGHVNFIAQNAVRTAVLSLTGGAFASAPIDGEFGRVLKQLTRWSACYALLADAAMGTLGGTLKRKELLSGRLADALAWMYIGSACVKRFVADGQPDQDRPFVRWTCAEALHQVQEAISGVLDNLPNRPVATLLRMQMFPLGRPHRPPSDRVVGACARALLDGGAARESLTRTMYVPPHTEIGLGHLERALALTVAAEPARKKLREAVKAKTLPRGSELVIHDAAVEKGVVSELERRQLVEAAQARDDVIQVDAFKREAHGDAREETPSARNYEPRGRALKS